MKSQQRGLSQKRHSILTRFTVVTIIALSLGFALSYVLLHFYNVWNLRNNGGLYVNYSKLTLEDSLAGTSYDECFSSSSNLAYQELRSEMLNVCEWCNADKLYLYTVNEARTERTFLFTVATDYLYDWDVEVGRSLGSVSTEPLSEAELQTLDGVESDEPEVVSNQFGNDLCFYRRVTLPDNKGYAILGLDYDYGFVDTLINDDTIAFVMPIVLAVFGIAIMELLLLKSYVIKPIRNVSTSMRAFAHDGKAPEEPLKAPHNDEIGEIVTSFNQMTTDIEHYVAHIEEMTEDRVAATTELQVARRIQQNLVPAMSHEEGFGYDAFAFVRTARAVGGDFYDMGVLEDGRLVIIVADVSGKGVSAALYMSMCLTLIHSKLMERKDPARALNEANDIMQSNNTENMFVTILAGIFDPTTGVLTYANAGHLPPLLTKGSYLNPDPGIALGLFEGAGIKNEKVTLKPGEGILFYTDGAVEANNEDKQFFGEERLAEAVSGSANAAEVVQAAVDAVDSFVAGKEQFDDLTLLALVVKDQEAQHWSAEVAPEVSSFSTISAHLQQLRVSKPLLSRVTLACDEAFANVANYSRASSVSIDVTLTDDQLTACMRDDGVPFDPLSNQPKERDFEDYEFGGMGIMFIKESCDSVSYEYVDGQNVLTMSFDL